LSKWAEGRRKEDNGEANREGKIGRVKDAAPDLSKWDVLQIGGFHRLGHRGVLSGAHRLGVYWQPIHPTKHGVSDFG